MAVEYICDGCGVRAPALSMAHGSFKPPSWFARGDDDGEQHACCRECIAKIAKKSGKTSTVLPV